MIRKFLIALAATMLPIAAQAQQFRPKDPIAIDPAKAYILYSVPADLPLVFVRTPTDEDRANYRTMRAAALETAKARYARDLRNYETRYRNWQRSKRREDGPTTEPKKPIEPTEDRFEFTPIERSQMVQVLSGRRALKEAGKLWYLIGVPAGEYSLYGSVGYLAGGYIGDCMCMGTVKFEAKPGVVTYLGEPILPEVRLPDPNTTLPAKFASLPVKSADYRAGTKFDNFFGIMIERVSAIPGVLRYERDRIIDVRAEGDAPSAK